jgi:iron(III) transport system ATP-binding protein
MSKVILQQVSKHFGETVAVEDFNAEIADGEFVSFLGPSGCGKTTTLRMVAGFLEPTAGEIVIGDRLVSSSAQRISIPPERRHIGMVFQSYAVWPHKNVFENVAYPLRIQKKKKAEIQTKVERVLGLVKLAGMGDRFPHQLSGGQQQRVALGRALVMEPDVMLLDEPLSNLDAKLREEMRFEIKDLQARIGVTIIYVTHDQAEAMAMSDRIFIMNAGRTLQVGTPKEIYEQPADRFVADFIGLTNLLPCEVAGPDRVVLDGTQGAAVACPVPAGISGRALISIRPEHIELTTAGEGIAGEVVRAVYLGRTVDYRIRVGQAELRAEGQATAPLREGDRVRLAVRQAMVFSLSLPES